MEIMELWWPELGTQTEEIQAHRIIMGKPFGKQPHEYRKWHKTINMDIWEKG
jgi:hypothetical protein